MIKFAVILDYITVVIEKSSDSNNYLKGRIQEGAWIEN